MTVRADIGDGPIEGLSDIVARLARAEPGRPALVFGGRTVSYDALDRRADRLAAALSVRLGAGERFAYIGRNSDSLFALVLAAIRSATCIVPVNWRLTPAEIAFVLGDCAAALVFADADYLAGIEAPDAGTPGGFEAVGADAAAVDAWAAAHPGGSRRDVHPDGAFVQLYTSGTTGFPKGVIGTNGRYALHLARLGRDPARPWLKTARDDVVLVSMPGFHVSGFGTTCEALAAGACAVLLPAFAAQAVLEGIDRHRVTRIFLVPSALRMVLEMPEIERFRLGSIAYLMYGGSAITPDLQALAGKHLRCHFLHCYGMTESLGNICVHDDTRDGATAGPGTVGLPLPETEMRIVAADGPVAAGVPGEVQLRSPTTFVGYWRRPDASADAYVDGGWMRTGDIGYRDAEGHLYLLDRLGDLIISGGENIYPIEVERVVAEHPAIAEVAVVGAPDVKWGQIVVASVALHPGAVLELKALSDWLDGRLARYKHPRMLDIQAELPRNATGKVMRTTLRERLARPPGG